MEVVRRGYVPKDTIEFGPKAAEKLSAAARELIESTAPEAWILRLDGL